MHGGWLLPDQEDKKMIFLIANSVDELIIYAQEKDRREREVEN